MRFDSLEYVAFCLIAIILLRVWKGGIFRDLTIAGLNLLFLISFASAPAYLVPLVLFIVVGYGAVQMARRRGSAFGIGIVIMTLIALFAWLKRYSLLGSLPSLAFPYVTVGLSYILFRIIHLVVDVAQGELRTPGFLSYLNYVLFFLSYVSGPIQRFQDFSAQASQPKFDADAQQLNAALGRIIAGYFMVIVICSLIAHLNGSLTAVFYPNLATGLGIRTIALFACLAFSQLVYLYVNFAGYMHICIGVGRLVGYSLPENFDQPYKSKNFLDLWARWHITLSQWFKFYLFNPLLKTLVKRAGASSNQSVQYFGAVAFFVTFLAMGIWHGTTNVFVFYGLLLGTGVTLNKIWQIQATKHLGKNRYKAICQQHWYAQLSRAAALSFFAIALTCIWIDPAQVNSIVSIRGMLAGALAFAALTTLLFLTCWGATIVNLPGRCIGQSNNHSGTIATAAITALKVFLLVNIALILGGAPEFVYKAF